MPLDEQSGVRAVEGELASAPQLTGKDWLSRSRRHIWAEILVRACVPSGDKQRA